MGAEQPFLRFGVGMRLIAGLSLIVIMMMSVIGLSLLTFRKFRSGYDHIASVTLPGLILSSQLERGSSLIASNAPAIISTKNQFTRQATMDKISDQLDMLNRLLHELRLLQMRGELDVNADNFQLIEQKRLELLTNLEELDRAVSQRIDVSQQLHGLLLKFPAMTTRLHTLAQDRPCAGDWTQFMHEAMLTALSVTAVANRTQLNHLRQKVTDFLANAEQSLSQCENSDQDELVLMAETHNVTTAITTVFTTHQQQSNYLRREAGLLNQNRQLADRFVMSASNLFASIRHEIDAENTQFQITVERHSKILLFVGSLFCGVALVIFLYVYRSVIRRLNELTATMRAHVEGRYFPINTRGHDEIAEMAHALEFFVHAIHSREAKLLIAKEKADAANKAKSAFLANMSHELRTPLNSILGFSQVMVRNRQSLSQENREHLGIIRRNGEHLLTLINQVLDLSKIEAGRMTLDTQNFDLHRLLNETEDMFALKAEQKQLRLLVERAEGVPRDISTDEVKLRQVLINLLNNAIKFTEKGHVTLKVAHLEEEHEASEICALQFQIEDTGPGIAPEEMDTLFEAFSQTETGRQAQEGTGLGLPICRKFVQLMGGDLRVRSDVGTGTTFSFHIQAGIAHQSALANHQPLFAKQTIALEAGQRAADGSPYRLLIVDDKPDNRTLLRELLGPFGFNLQEAANGQEALEIWDSWNPHLIWMDMRMPILDGYNTTKQIRATEATRTDLPQTTIIAVTASSLEEERAIVLQAGCDDFLRKPFHDEDIVEMLHRHLGIRFVYAEQSSHSEDRTPATAIKSLIREKLLTLPADWLTALRRAAECADSDEIFILLEQMQPDYPAETDAVATLVNDFAFDELIELISLSTTTQEERTA